MLLWGEDGDVELAQAVRVADDVDPGDLPVCQGEAKYAEEAAFRSDDEADFAVDECRLCGACAAGGDDCALRPILCAADFPLRFDWLGDSIGADDNVGIEHGNECAEIAGAQSGEERVHDFALAGEIGVSTGVCALDTSAGTACELARRGGGAADDGGDLFEGNSEEVVQDEADALRGSESVEDNEEREADGFGKQRLLFGIERVRCCCGFGRRVHVLFQRIFATRIAGAQHIQADTRDDSGEPSAEVLDSARIGTAEFEPRFLHGIIGFAE